MILATASDYSGEPVINLEMGWDEFERLYALASAYDLTMAPPGDITVYGITLTNEHRKEILGALHRTHTKGRELGLDMMVAWKRNWTPGIAP